VAKRRPRAEFVFPARILVDTREQAPYSFRGLFADAADGCTAAGLRLPLLVPTARVALPAGDYAVEGFQTRCAVERKSLADLYSTLSQGRDRFRREVERLSGMEFAAVVVEASLARILSDPPPHSDMRPRAVVRTMISWAVRYGVHFLTCEDRGLAEIMTFRLLQRHYLNATGG
jgi:DNA excision repair protein ERCC-4